MTTFKDLGLSTTLLNVLDKCGYQTPTPIQTQAIPHLLSGHDLLGIAQTGTGKTAAFALPILHFLLADRKMPQPRSTRALILSPTRELASQIADSFKTYGSGMGLQIATIFGGVKYGPQYKALANGLDILVATPGRLMDHLEQKTIDLKQVEFFVLDEADQMLDLGFVKPIRQMASRLPAQRQNLFFSATMPKEIGLLASELLTNPKKVEITPESTTAERVDQSIIYIESIRKRALLSELYAEDALSRTLVFTRTKRSADRVAAYLQAGGVEAAAIHGDKNQGQRERALQAFKAGKVRALVATDIAARGIDVEGVTHVINYELPYVAEAYVHRIGRTARAGKSGISITLCSDDERKLIKDIQRMIRQTLPSFDRRKDKALALLDEAILASGQTEKPKTPDRIKEARHIDGDAERVHKRGRNRPGRDNASDSRFGGDRGRPARRDGGSRDDQARPERDFSERSRPQRAHEVFDPMAAERPAFNAERPAKRFEKSYDKPFRQNSDRPQRSERSDRPERSERPAREFGESSYGRPEGRSEGRSDFRSDSRSNDRPRGRSNDRFSGNDRAPERSSERSERAPERGNDRYAERKPAFGARPDRPHSDRGNFDKPRFEKPRSDKPRSDKPSFGKPGFGKSRSDKPKFDGARSERSGSDRPRSDRSEGAQFKRKTRA